MSFDVKIRAHESFYIRRGWLQKGVKNLRIDNRIFNDKNSNACDVLGIGANMVKSLKYWLTATGIANEVTKNGKRFMEVSKLGNLIDQYDRFYEEIGTNIIVHYQLIKNKSNATAWYWLFNEFDGTVIDKDLFIAEFNAYLKLNGKAESKVLDDEFNCILKTYIATDSDDDPEETKVCPLAELGLLTISDASNKEIRKISMAIDAIHPLIAFALICDYAGKKIEVSINDLCNKSMSIGKSLNLSRIGLFSILDELAKRGLIAIERTSGLDVINILKPMSYLDALELYYKELNGDVL